MRAIWKRGAALLLLCCLLMSITVSASAQEADVLPAEAPAEESAAPAESPAPSDAPAVLTAAAAKSYAEFFVSKDGSDESGDGSEAKPFASLAKAAEASNAAADKAVYIIVLTDLELRNVARFAGKDVTIQGDNGQKLLTRAENFAPAQDETRGSYNPALIEMGTLGRSGQTAGSLKLENIVLDDAGRSAGRQFVPAVDKNTVNTEKVQDAMIAVYDNGKLTLSAGSELRNFGGLSAIRLLGSSALDMEQGSAILDNLEGLGSREIEAQEAPKAILSDAGALVKFFEDAHVTDRGVTRPTEEKKTDQDEKAAPEAEESPAPEASPAPSSGLLGLEPSDLGGDGTSLVTLEFSGPETLTRLEDSSLTYYKVDYTLTFTVSDTVKNVIETAKQAGITASCSGVIAITLDERLEFTTLRESVLTSSVFELDGDPSFDSESHVLTAKFMLKEDFEGHLSELTEPMTFSCPADLSALKFEESTPEEDKYLTSSALVTLNYAIEGNTNTYTTDPKEAKTKMLGLGICMVSYDPNGGAGAPEAERVSAQNAYKLKTEPAPTHEDIDGKPVVFIGWTETKDGTIYTRDSETKPDTVETVKVTLENNLLNPKVVYAVYGYDEYGEDGPDGVADVLQEFVTLRYDPNGGKGGPEPQVKLAGTVGAKFDIAPEEPTLDSYTFQGWSKDPAATEAKYKYNSEKASQKDILITEDTTLYAVWQENPSYTLTYNANGGSNPPAAQSQVSLYVGGDYVAYMTITNAAPSRPGYSFAGWGTARRGNAEFFAGEDVELRNGNVTLYAIWTRNGQTPGGTNGDTTNPKTGDTVQPVLYGMLAGFTLLSAAALAILRRHLKRD